MGIPSSGGPLLVEVGGGGALWRVQIRRGAGNLLDLETVEALARLFEEARGESRLCTLLLTAEGPDFSLGAEPAELMPGRVERFLPAFFGLIERMLDSSLFLIAALRGRCLGAGLELISVFGRIYAAPEVRVGLPQLELGLIAPVASLTLPERIGTPAALELCASAHIKRADEASWVGLVDHVVAEPERVALGEIEHFLVPLSASSIRYAVRALNLGLRGRFKAGAGEMLRLYLERLMATADAREGLQARAEGRPPRWTHA